MLIKFGIFIKKCSKMTTESQRIQEQGTMSASSSVATTTEPHLDSSIIDEEDDYGYCWESDDDDEVHIEQIVGWKTIDTKAGEIPIAPQPVRPQDGQIDKFIDAYRANPPAPIPCHFRDPYDDDDADEYYHWKDYYQQSDDEDEEDEEDEVHIEQLEGWKIIDTITGEISIVRQPNLPQDGQIDKFIDVPHIIPPTPAQYHDDDDDDEDDDEVHIIPIITQQMIPSHVPSEPYSQVESDDEDYDDYDDDPIYYPLINGPYKGPGSAFCDKMTTNVPAQHGETTSFAPQPYYQWQ